MQPRRLTLSSAGTYYASPDWLQAPFSLSYSFNVPTGSTISATINYTIDDVNDPTFPPQWKPDPTNGGTLTASCVGTYSTPVRFIEIIVTAVTGAAYFDYLQGFSAP